MEKADATDDSGHLLLLDALRGLAALSIVLYHRRWWAPGAHLLDHAYLAVDFFFMLSGLILDHAYRRRLQDGMSFWNYANRRLIRLYPLIVLGGLLGLLSAGGDYWNLKAFVFAASALPAPADVAPDPFFFNRPSWSLMFEIIASLAFGAVGFRLGGRVLAVAVTIAGVIWMDAVLTHGTVAFGFGRGDLPWGLIRVGFPFTLGIVLSRARRLKDAPQIPVWLPAVILVGSFTPRDIGRFDVMYQVFLVTMIFPPLIYFSSVSRPLGRVSRVASWSAFLSYPIYAIHYPVQNFVAQFLHRSDRTKLAVAVVLAIVLALAAGIADDRLRAWLSLRLSTRRRAIFKASV